MKIDYISDLHIDFHVKEVNEQRPKFKALIAEFIDNILPTNRSTIGDVLILAGDHSHYNSQTKELLKQLKEIYKDVVIVTGNHDLYMISDNIRKKYQWDSSQRVIELKEIAEEVGVHFLDGNVIDINGVRFGGTGGWYSLPTPDDISHWNYSLNDSNLIYDGYPVNLAYSYGRAKADWDTQKHYREELQKLKDIAKEGCDVLVTHVAQVIPPDKDLPAMYRGDPGNIFYYVDNLDLIKESKTKVHLYGHTHNEHDYVLDGVRCVCNPLGYPKENPNLKIKSFDI